ncbi:MAG: metallophosphoesterase family protein [Ginsengibacter sp.]
MMIGVFSDAHGNEPGFYKCYDYLLKYSDVIYYLGDAVGYFPLSNNIIDTLRINNIYCLKGNHDAMLLGELSYEKHQEEIYQIKKCRTAISVENLHFLKDLKSQKEVIADNRTLLFVHGSPSNPLNGYIYPDTEIDYFQKLPYNAIFMGHTHLAFIKTAAEKNLVNVGSCGLPRDVGNKLTVVLYDTKKKEAAIREFEMNVKEVIKKYGSEIHLSVIDVLNRNNKPFINE